MHSNHRFQEAKLIDVTFMAKALVQARRAFELDEVPIGAVVVVEGNERLRPGQEVRAEPIQISFP